MAHDLIIAYNPLCPTACQEQLQTDLQFTRPAVGGRFRSALGVDGVLPPQKKETDSLATFRRYNLEIPGLIVTPTTIAAVLVPRCCLVLDVPSWAKERINALRSDATTDLEYTADEKASILAQAQQIEDWLAHGDTRKLSPKAEMYVALRVSFGQPKVTQENLSAYAEALAAGTTRLRVSYLRDPQFVLDAIVGKLIVRNTPYLRSARVHHGQVEVDEVSQIGLNAVIAIHMAKRNTSIANQ